MTGIEEIPQQESSRKHRGDDTADVDIFLDNVVWTMERLLGGASTRIEGTEH